jgi:hypothetical protein
MKDRLFSQLFCLVIFGEVFETEKTKIKETLNDFPKNRLVEQKKSQRKSLRIE